MEGRGKARVLTIKIPFRPRVLGVKFVYQLIDPWVIWIKFEIFKVILVIGDFGEIALKWLSLDLTDDKSTLLSVMVQSGNKLLPEPVLT